MNYIPLCPRRWPRVFLFPFFSLLSFFFKRKNFIYHMRILLISERMQHECNLESYVGPLLHSCIFLGIMNSSTIRVGMLQNYVCMCILWGRPGQNLGGKINIDAQISICRQAFDFDYNHFGVSPSYIHMTPSNSDQKLFERALLKAPNRQYSTITLRPPA